MGEAHEDAEGDAQALAWGERDAEGDEEAEGQGEGLAEAVPPPLPSASDADALPEGLRLAEPEPPLLRVALPLLLGGPCVALTLREGSALPLDVPEVLSDPLERAPLPVGETEAVREGEALGVAVVVVDREALPEVVPLRAPVLVANRGGEAVGASPVEEAGALIVALPPLTLGEAVAQDEAERERAGEREALGEEALEAERAPLRDALPLPLGAPPLPQLLGDVEAEAEGEALGGGELLLVTLRVGLPVKLPLPLLLQVRAPRETEAAALLLAKAPEADGEAVPLKEAGPDEVVAHGECVPEAHGEAEAEERTLTVAEVERTPLREGSGEALALGEADSLREFSGVEHTVAEGEAVCEVEGERVAMCGDGDVVAQLLNVLLPPERESSGDSEPLALPLVEGETAPLREADDEPRGAVGVGSLVAEVLGQSDAEPLLLPAPPLLRVAVVQGEGEVLGHGLAERLRDPLPVEETQLLPLPLRNSVEETLPLRVGAAPVALTQGEAEAEPVVLWDVELLAEPAGADAETLHDPVAVPEGTRALGLPVALTLAQGEVDRESGALREAELQADVVGVTLPLRLREGEPVGEREGCGLSEDADERVALAEGEGLPVG